MNNLELFSHLYRDPASSVRTNEILHFSIRTELQKDIFFICRSDSGEEIADERMSRSGDEYRCDIAFDKSGLYYYYFSDGGSEFLSMDRFGQTYLSNECCWAQLLVVDEKYAPADSFFGGIAYQIFPDRFAISGEVPRLPGRVYHDDISDIPVWRADSRGEIRNNDFYGGNLKGIESRLDYLSELGVTLIYLNPIFEARSNHRYDTGDYMVIDRQLGTEEDFRCLCRSAKDRGIRIILDGVFSHTGDDSVYFNKYGSYPSLGAYQDRNSPYFSWYKFSSWPDRYDSWWGVSTLPEVDEMVESYSEFIAGEGGVIDHWMKAGASGFRLDVADELPDEFIRKIREAIRRNDPDGLLIGEVWEDASNKISYSRRRQYFWGEELDGVMNYPFKEAVLDFIREPDAASFFDRVMNIYIHYPIQMLSSSLNMLSSHDTARAINALSAPGELHCSREVQASRTLDRSEYLRGIEMLKLAYALMFFLPGIPMVYYGDEIGMQGYGDPFCRGFFRSDAPDNNMLEFMKELGKTRSRYRDVLADGELEFFHCDGAQIGFYRKNSHGRIAFLLNRGSEPAVFSVSGHETEVPAWQYRVIRL